MARSFQEEWRAKIERVRGSAFWRQVSNPPAAAIVPDTTRPGPDDVTVDPSWRISVDPPVDPGGKAALALEDLRRFLKERLGVEIDEAPGLPGRPGIELRLRADPRRAPSRWDGAFDLAVSKSLIRLTAPSEEGLLRGSIYLSNLWSLRRAPRIAMGRRRIRPAIDLHVGADLWGGFSTTQAWVEGRETDTNWIELARMGINAVPVMTLLEDYLEPEPSSPFGLLANNRARENRERLAALARQSAHAGVHVMLMGYNPKLRPEHPLFAAYPQASGSLQAGGAFRSLCPSDPATRAFLAGSWASLFAEIPELGGLIAITGGEGFYHCFMRGAAGAADCPRCSHRDASTVVAELVNDVARAIHASNPEARVITWPYSAGHWSGDRDQDAFIQGLDPEHVIFQTEVDKDSVDWRPAGYAKNIWDYSVSMIGTSERSRRQRALCAARGLDFSAKIECGNSIECLSVPYLPALENQRRIWENARALRPYAIHSRWLFDGSCKSPSEELGYWMIWGEGTGLDDPDAVLDAIARRDFGVRAAPAVRRAWRLFSEALRHHPMLDYYRGSFFVGAGQPLVLDPETPLDPAFYGRFYWLWEASPSTDAAALETAKPLFYSRPAFRALARRGPRKGQDVALEELKTMASLWERGVRELASARPNVPPECRPRYAQELVLARHLGYTWRSGANVEEFLRVRDVLAEFSGRPWVRSGHAEENRQDLHRLQEIARAELRIAVRDLALVRDVDFLDLSLRTDMGTASTVRILEAKIRQVEALLETDLPGLGASLARW